VKVDFPLLVNLRLDPLERTGLSQSINNYSWFAYEFWRFVFVQKVVAKFARVSSTFRRFSLRHRSTSKPSRLKCRRLQRPITLERDGPSRHHFGSHSRPELSSGLELATGPPGGSRTDGQLAQEHRRVIVVALSFVIAESTAPRSIFALVLLLPACGFSVVGDAEAHCRDLEAAFGELAVRCGGHALAPAVLRCGAVVASTATEDDLEACVDYLARLSCDDFIGAGSVLPEPCQFGFTRVP
jgi:hypothetical protein